VANRLRARSRAADELEARLSELGAAPLARLSERAAYAELAEQGLSIFDRRLRALDPVRAQWAPILSALGA
jgi:chromosome partitioning protein